MIKIVFSAAIGAAVGAYAASSPIVKSSHQHEAVKSASINPHELMKEAKDLPVIEVGALF